MVSRSVVNSGGLCEPGPVVSRLDVAVLDLVGRHPFLSTENLAAMLGRDVEWARRKRSALVKSGLVRRAWVGEASRGYQTEQELLELTRNGLEVLAGHLGLLLGEAVRHHGLAGGGPVDPVGARESLFHHLEHTLGADAVFASVARAAASHPSGGALVEWRSAAACAHGRFRPDGYGLVHLGREQHGFFLEFDRGTMRADRLRAKFVAYYRYRSSRHAHDSFAGFPVLLIVTTGPGAELRLVRALRAAELGQHPPLRALLTTTGLLESTRGGPLGTIWRTVGAPTRCRAWP
jgi:hypothetical protein